MLRYAEHTSAHPDVAWRLIARPEHWPDWSPHLRGAWGLAGPDGFVREGARGAARLLGVVPVPARITEVRDGRSWTWQVGPVEMAHQVVPDATARSGCTVEITMSAPAGVERVLAATYGRLVALLVRHLAHVADEV